MSRVLLEVCVADAASLAAAVVGGADRVELCSALEQGGLTATPGLMALAAAAPVPVRALIRPRSGDFVFDEADVASMLADIAYARALGLSGVVLGASRPDGSLDLEVLARLVRASAGLSLSLHRAIDLVPDIAAATEAAIQLGFDTVLTSGGAATAIEGVENIAKAHAVAAGRATIMPGSGVSPDNVGALLARVPVAAVHSTCSVAAHAPSAPAVRLGFANDTRRVTSAAVVSSLKAALR
ncbi:copper homeostasis protein CutC [Devosia epidermidihirudinis]|uniref:PF03932 family protein CutC n=1 Tax=Devosia epidermidihirudinis TaxID=1293439 RepID=A0A0F5QLI6_9HYPH|nr:copper homeostasis protein CutC [Devosia epidermidihirudinis]KKC40909.1 copper homeostasis protein CutC [Devosia epidermidihirudinis]